MPAVATTKIGGPGYVGSGGIYTSTVDPNGLNDINAGFNVGDKIFNITSQVVLVCLDNTATAAVWRLEDVFQTSFVWTANTGANTPFFVAPRKCKVANIMARVEVAGTNGSAVTAVIVKAPAATAISAGTAIHAGTLDLKGAATLDQLPTLNSDSSISLANGDCLGFQLTGTPTSAVGAVTLEILPA